MCKIRRQCSPSQLIANGISLCSTHYLEKMLLLGHTKSLFLRLAGSSFISVVKPPPHRAISALTAALSKTHEVKSSDVKVSVWWDFDKCCFPADENVVKVAENITSAVRTNGIKGPITINGYGDLLMLSKKNQEAIFPNGISLIHVPHGWFKNI